MFHWHYNFLCQQICNLISNDSPLMLRKNYLRHRPVLYWGFFEIQFYRPQVFQNFCIWCDLCPFVDRLTYSACFINRSPPVHWNGSSSLLTLTTVGAGVSVGSWFVRLSCSPLDPSWRPSVVLVVVAGAAGLKPRTGQCSEIFWSGVITNSWLTQAVESDTENCCISNGSWWPYMEFCHSPRPRPYV